MDGPLAVAEPNDDSASAFLRIAEALYLFGLTHFLDANRYPRRSKML